MNPQFLFDTCRDAVRSIGYSDSSIRRDYKFTDFEGQRSFLRQVPFAAFSAYPPSYRNSCIAVIASDSQNFGERWVQKHFALCSPLVFEVKDNGNVVQPWSLGVKTARFAGEAFTLSKMKEVCQRNKEIWNPQFLSRVKSSFGEALPQQLDFIDVGLLPMVEGFFQAKLKDLLEKSFTDTKTCFQDVHGVAPRTDYLFAYLFRFVTAKIFQDRADVEGWANLNDPSEILEKAIAHSGSASKAELPTEFLNAQVLETAWKSIATNLNFQNLSVPDLAVIYEDSFITDETRRDLGIHSTPVALANYIVEKLPWEQLPVEDRRVFEPFCGHGVFLARALERLQRDLDSTLTPPERHQYFRRMLVGVEKDALALEVCRLILTLSDYPNDNSWKLHHDDVFTWPEWNATLASAGAVLANPPYEAFGEEERHRVGARKAQPPAEMLSRLLRQPPLLLGLVLPQSFLSGPSYREANRQIAERYEQVSIVELPRIFRYANNQTLALMASGRREKGNSVSVRFAEVRQDEVKDFLDGFKISNERFETLKVAAETKAFSLWLPPQNSITQWFSASLPRLESLATIHKGINWIAREDNEVRIAPRTDVASDTPTEGFMRGVEKMRGNLSQFRVAEFRYLSLLSKHQDPRTKANERPWNKKKVVCNAGRFQENSPWRIAAWTDDNGVAFTKQFFAIWPDDEVSTFALAAVLCSPVANAFIREVDRGRDNRISTLRQLPFPSKEKLGYGGLLHRQSKEVQKLFSNKEFSVQPSSEQLTEALLRLDAAVLDAYELSAQAQRHLLDQFRGWKRPVNTIFDRYFTEDFSEVASLSDYVAVKYDWKKWDERRCELIERNISQASLSPQELEDLEHLQALADLWLSINNPEPLNALDALIGKLKSEGKWIDSI